MASSASAHIPVMLQEILELVGPQAGTTGVDCTLGLGGHAEAIMKATEGQVRLIGLDVDPSSLEAAGQRLAAYGDRVTRVHRNFGELATALKELGQGPVDFIYADLGVSSPQLDVAERGFSFDDDGPLDMRMDPRLQKRAADLVNSLKEGELADIFYDYGQETRSRKVAAMIMDARRSHRLDSTKELASIVCHALGFETDRLPHGKKHPATRVFQALRIAVNNELGQLQNLLAAMDKCLAVGGVAAVISFHSLEDALVKSDFVKKVGSGRYASLTKKALTPSPSEILRNSRSRSAKLRAVKKIS